MVYYVYADLCSLLAATSQFSIPISRNMQLTGCHNVNKMRNATCADTQISIEWPYCSFLYCGLMPFITCFFSQENACDFLTAGVASNSSTFPGCVFRWVVRLLSVDNFCVFCLENYEITV